MLLIPNAMIPYAINVDVRGQVQWLEHRKSWSLWHTGAANIPRGAPVLECTGKVHPTALCTPEHHVRLSCSV